MVFRCSGFDRFSFFERVLPFDTESADQLVFDTFSPFYTESGFDRAELFDRFLKMVFRVSGCDWFTI